MNTTAEAVAIEKEQKMSYAEDKNKTVTISLEEFSEAEAAVVAKIMMGAEMGPPIPSGLRPLLTMFAPPLFAMLAHEIFDPDDGEQAMDEVSDRDRKTAPSD